MTNNIMKEGIKKSPESKNRMDKKGWIRIVEAFVAILIILGAVLTIVDREYFIKDDESSEVYNLELSILREISVSNSLRDEVLNANPVPVGYDSFPSNVKIKIEERVPYNFICTGKICATTDACLLDFSSEKDIYAQSIIISASLESYSPRQLKLFCWEK